MSDKERLILEESGNKIVRPAQKKPEQKLPWYFASGFLLFWILLFFAVVQPFFYRLPPALTIEEANSHEFIAERAYKNLYYLSNIGTKMVGSEQNEVTAVNYLLQELNKIKDESLQDFFDIEIDLSLASGQFEYEDTINMYQGVQNIAVKFSSKNSTSQSYLLVNSHFDSKPETPSAGDAGFMIIVMMEVLRTMATTRQRFEHPIVFLFNGAEESAMLASHGFMTGHRWAKNLKAVVNLDAAGSGGREMVFQSGPGNSWLVDYYHKNAKHPFGTTMGEEIYQTGKLPSDTDYNIFKRYMPGLDIGQITNGYIYHTKYDVIDVIPRESVQNTGDNILSLVRALSNATELHDIENHKTGHAVFFDFLGLFFVSYSEATGIALNYGIAGTTLLFIFISMWRMAAISNISICEVMLWYILVIVMQLISCVLAIVFPIIVTTLLDNWGYSLAHYSMPILIIGLYVSSSLIGLTLPMTIYYSIQCSGKLSKPYHLQLGLHAHAFIMSVSAFYLTSVGLRSTYVLVIPLAFYLGALLLNMLTTMHDRGYAWTGMLKFCQIFPFLYSTYASYLFIVVILPMTGRSGSAFNIDLIITVISALGTVLSFGFLIPLINTFRKPSLVIFSLIAITCVSMYLATSTQLGFPYRARTNGHRAAYLQTRSKFYEFDGTLSKDESGYLFNFQDRLEEKPLQKYVNLEGLQSIRADCQTHMMCGKPLYDFRYVQNRLQSKFLTRVNPIEMPGDTTLKLLNKIYISNTTVRFEFVLEGPSQMNLFFQPYEDITISNWSFLQSYLKNPPPHPLAYHIFFNYGVDKSPVEFFVEITKSNGNFKVPLFQLGVSGHFVGDPGDEESQRFKSTFPPYSIVATWPAYYQRFIF